MDRSS